MSPEACQSEP
jgi:NIMA (never in mitosis gene a)-related kinase 1/4/5